MRCNIFLKKVWAFFAFHAHSFFKKPFMGQILSAHFPGLIPLLSFFFIFSYPELSKKEIPKLRLVGIIACDHCTQSVGKRGKRQRYDGATEPIINKQILLHRHTAVRGDGSVQTPGMKRPSKSVKGKAAIYWRNLGKHWQNGVNTSQKNGAFGYAQVTGIFLWITERKSGWKDSGMEGVKKMLCLAIFSTRHKHTINLSL